MAKKGKFYRKYLNGAFDPSKIAPIQNDGWIKPTGGCWASPVEAEYSWEWWASSEMPHWLEQDVVDFKLKESAKVYELHSIADFLAMPMADEEALIPDFEALEALGYDALELFLSDEPRWDVSLEKRETLYVALYGWDCDSIIIFNGDAIDMESVTVGETPAEIKERMARSKSHMEEIGLSYYDDEEEDCAEVI